MNPLDELMDIIDQLHAAHTQGQDSATLVGMAKAKADELRTEPAPEGGMTDAATVAVEPPPPPTGSDAGMSSSSASITSDSPPPSTPSETGTEDSEQP